MEVRRGSKVSSKDQKEQAGVMQLSGKKLNLIPKFDPKLQSYLIELDLSHNSIRKIDISSSATSHSVA
jgi:hypothetical protein